MPRFRGCFAGFKGESPNLLTAFALSPQQDKAMKNTYTLDASAMIHLASMTRTHTNSFRITITLLETIDHVTRSDQ
jgi:hypothetical protein